MRRLSKNLGFLILSQGVTAGAAVIVLAISARYLGPARFGQYAVLRAIIGMTLPLIGGGMRANLIKEIGRDPENAGRYLGVLLTLRWALILATTVVAVVVITILPLNTALEWAAYAALLSAFSSFWDAIARAIFVAYEKSEYNLRLSLANSVLIIPFTVIAVHLDTGVAGVLASAASARLITSQAGFFIAWRHFVRPILRIDVNGWHAILKRSLPIGIGSMLKQSYDRVDVWLLTALRDSAAAGIFNGAYRVVIQVVPASILVASGLLPRLSLLVRVAPDQLRTVFERLVLFLLLLSVPAAGLVASFSEPIIRVFFGPEFAESIGALRILSLMIVTSIPDTLFFFTLVALGKERRATSCLLASILANILFDLILIPLLGVRGACFGTVGAEWTFFLTALISIHLEIALPSPWKFIGKPVAAGIGMAAVLSLTQHMNPAVSFLSGLFIYVLLVGALRSVPRGSIRSLRKALIPPIENPV